LEQKKCLIDSTTPIFGKSIDLIKNKYQEDLSKIFLKERWEEVICYFELYGPSSFAGSHVETEAQMVTLFDIAPYKNGFLEPIQFYNLFYKLDISALLYDGKANASLIESVKNSTLPGMTFEGVVCKCKNDKKTKMQIMFKIKSQA
jgi:hypothetical protein